MKNHLRYFSMTSIYLSPEIKKVCEKKAHDAEKNPNYTRVPLRTKVKLIKNLIMEADMRGHKIICDEADSAQYQPEEGNPGPNPIEVFLSGYAFCFVVTMAKNAAIRELSLDSVEMDAKSITDRAGYYLGIGDRSIISIDSDVHLVSTESRETISDLIKITEERCPASQTLSKATKLTYRYYLNEQELIPSSN